MSDNNTPTPRRRRFGLWLLLSLAFMAGAMAIAVLVFTGRLVTMPDWVTDRVEARLNKTIAPVAIDLGGMDVYFSRSGVPQVHLRDVSLTDGQGRPVAQLPELDAVLAGDVLLQGQIHFRHVALTGARINMRRSADGALDLALGDATVPVGTAETLIEVLEQIDTAFATPVLAAVESVSIEQMALTYEDARAGRVWQVENGLLTLDQTPQDVSLQVFFSLRNDAGTPSEVALNFGTRKGTPEARMSANFSDMPAADIATQSPALAFLTVIDAPISGAVRTGVTADGGLAPLSASLEIGAGALKPVAEAKPIRFDRGKSYFKYDPVARKLTFDAISVDTEGLRLRADGHAYLRDDVAGWPTSLISQMQFRRVELDPEGMFQEPAIFTEGALDLKVKLDPFTATIGQVVLIDPAQVAYRGKGRVLARPEGWQVDLDINLDQVKTPDLLKIWPVSVAPPTRRWVSENVLSGELFDVKAALRLAPGAPARVSLNHEFRDATVRFMKKMPPIEQGYGYASISDNAFTLVVEKGAITAPQGGQVDVAGSVMQVPDISIRNPAGDFHLRTDSQIAPLLSVLDQPPLRVMSKAGRPIDLAQGRARAEARIKLVLKKDIKIEDVEFSVDGTLLGVSSDQLVPGRSLTADTLNLRVNNDEMAISGSAQLDGVPFQGAWSQKMGREHAGVSRVDGTIELSQRFLDAFNIGLPAGSVSGAGAGAIVVDLVRDQAPTFRLTSDLKRMGLRLPGLNWSKSKNSGGKLTVAGALGSPARIDQLDLSAPGLSANGSVQLSADGALQEARFDRVRLDGWLDAPVVLRGRGKGRAPAVALLGGTADLRNNKATGAGGGGTGSDTPIEVALDRLIISKTLALTRVRGTLSQKGGLNGRITGRVNGGARIEATLAPARNGTAVRVRSDDAGGVLKSAGIFQKSRGGELDMILQPRGPAGDYDGTMNIKRTRVKGAPVLAEMLTAISVVGILELLDGDGLVFSEVSADFRLTPAAMQIKRGSAIGPSLGISMAGLYGFESNRMDMRGVISPIYLLNGIGSVLTRKGEGLFGFNYRMSGDAKQPKVGVNPLSILTPGMFREIFRRAPPEIPN